MPKIDQHCPKCDSTEIGFTANAVWSVDAQTWVLGNIFEGDGWCGSCNAEFNTAVEKPIDPVEVAVQVV